MLRPSLSLFTKAASRTTVVRPPPLTPPRFIIPARAMSTEAQKPVPAGKTEFKILMLHGMSSLTLTLPPSPSHADSPALLDSRLILVP